MEDIDTIINRLLCDGYAEDVGAASDEDAGAVVEALHKATGKTYWLQINVNNEGGAVYYDMIASESKKSGFRFETWDL